MLQLQDFWRAAVPSDLGALRCPVHFVSASRDRVADPAFAERLRQRIPGASHLLVVGANHYLPWESPALAAGLLRELLDGRDPAGRGHPEIARYTGQEAP
jgi:pimeloyl-ACP methyl ester carboxylesterase